MTSSYMKCSRVLIDRQDYTNRQDVKGCQAEAGFSNNGRSSSLSMDTLNYTHWLDIKGR